MLKPIICIAAALAFGACGNHSHQHNHGHEHEAHEHAEGHEHGDHDGEAKGHAAHGEIILHSDIAERFGVETDTARAGEFMTVVEASGVVLPSTTSEGVVTAPTAGIVRFAPGIEAGRDVTRGTTIATIDARSMSGGDANAAGAAALAAAKREFERIDALYKERLATVGEYNAALAAYEQAKAGYSSSASKGLATAPISGVLATLNVASGQYAAAGEVIATIASNTAVNLRVDLPQKYYRQAADLTDATLSFSYLDEPVTVSAAGGKRTGVSTMPAPGATAAYIPVYFTVPGKHGILPGSSFTAHLLGKGRQGVITVPNTALLEQQGEFFVFEKLDDECYTKRRVRTGANNGLRTEILEGLPEGTPYVSVGATTVRLAETGAAIPQGHTHNH